MHTSSVAADVAAKYLDERKAQAIYSDPYFAGMLNYVANNKNINVPQTKKWLDHDLNIILDVENNSGAYVVRFDRKVRKALPVRGKHQVSLNHLYGFLDQHADKKVIKLSYGRQQRFLMKYLWKILENFPLPNKIKTRLGSAFSRHLAVPILVIYHVQFCKRVP